MSRLRRFLGVAWGLRPRLVVAFVLIAAISAAAASGATYVLARRVIEQDATDAVVTPMISRVHQSTIGIKLPPTQDQLDSLAFSVGNGAVAVYQNMRSKGGMELSELTPELREEMRTGSSVVWQRVTIGNYPAMIIGIPVLAWQTDDSWKPSGLEIYAVSDLTAQQNSIKDLASFAWLFGALSALFAVIVALLAARGVLRPVRQLGITARRLGAGDLSARLKVRGNDEMAELARTFNDTAAALEHHVGQLRRMEADARRFVADVSHELRTPLAAMTAVTDVLDEEAPQLGDDAGQAARLVSQETRKLTRLVEDLMEVSRFDAGAAKLALDDIDVASAIGATLRARGWLGRVEADLPAGVVARLDPRRLDVIVANLVGNALKHGAPPVQLRLWADHNWVELRVMDNGPGLAPEVLPHVFDRFYKAEFARTRSEGSGLGLAIAWENARLHSVGGLHGSLEAANRPEGGAVFILRLPRVMGEDPR
ncbi:ATP-binding protein [Kutzneria kofuensis]|uniref:histidine kinase n=1 Tax=Kutzneria kofuensis TaxID=103725 RepID=A0A7W9KJH8_9PSEU|nr:ATP-binding protein [Kutzneria kofuensis]MBB5893681.1 two-component system sensor histidine kinase MtrB [Kutzneria kofuensis]